jgi:isocitrate dehydrogenase (NAD+)
MRRKTITIIPGDGIDPEIMQAALAVLDALDCGLDYAFADAGLAALEKGEDLLPQATEDLIAKNRVALKGPLTTPVGEGFTSLNVALRKRFDLYANLRPAISYPGTAALYDNIDIITIRENTEGMYAAEHQELSTDGERAESVSVVTRAGAARILHLAYETARVPQEAGCRRAQAEYPQGDLRVISKGGTRDRRRLSRDRYERNDCGQYVHAAGDEPLPV